MCIALAQLAGDASQASVSTPVCGAAPLPRLVGLQGAQRLLLGFVVSDCSVAMETKTLATCWADEK